MKMPYRLRPEPKQPVWRVNTQQEPVDEMYDRFLGRVGETIKDQELQSTRGSDLLPEEIKVHYSHDQGPNTM
jgi:large subunit ribosomal protein L15